MTIKNIRELDDLNCTNYITTKCIKKLVKKHSSLKTKVSNCFINGTQYIMVDVPKYNFIWFTDGESGFVKRYNKSKLVDDIKREWLEPEELNRLIVNTYRHLCDSLGDDIDLADTPEDILAYAEQQLQNLLSTDSLD